MLPPGFKKDSRVWLHKNPKARTEDVDKTAVLRRFLDSDRSAFNETSPCFFVERPSGKQFKKDSRSWLHKSSLKKQQQQKMRRKGPGLVAGDCREPEFARSNTEVRMPLQEKFKRKSGAFYASDGDIISNDYSLKQVLRKKRGEATLYGGMALRKPVRTLSEERLNEEVCNIMTYASLNTFHDSVETIGEHGVTELADEVTCPASEDDEEEEVNSNHTTRPCRSDPQEHLRYHVQSYPSLLTCHAWREAAGVKSDTSSSGHSKGSMDTLAPVCEDMYNVNAKGEKRLSHDLLTSVADKLRACPSDSRSSMESTCKEHAQLRMISLAASPPGSPCSGGSISEEDLKSSDIDV